MTVAEQVYNMLTMKQKRELEDEYNIDCALDLQRVIYEEHTESITI